MKKLVLAVCTSVAAVLMIACPSDETASTGGAEPSGAGGAGAGAGAGGGNDGGGGTGDGGAGEGGGDGGSISSWPAPVPATQQTQCYDASGAVIDCAGTGQDGDKQAGVPWPSPRFVVRTDGTVRDNLTGLVWLQDADCLGQVVWQEALTRSRDLADGQCDLTDGSASGDWRLPNLNELATLIDISKHYPALSDAAGTGAFSAGDPFINVRNMPYWTSTTRSGGTDGAWIVSPFASGSFRGEDKADPQYVWPVRDDTGANGTPTLGLPVTHQTNCYNTAGDAIDCAGTGQDGDIQSGVPWPNPRFTDSDDGTILDNLTGLVWLKQADCLENEVTLPEALSHSNGLADGQCDLSDGSAPGDWRLPNFRELFSLMDWSRNNPTLSNTDGTAGWSNDDPFTGVRTMLHWTSTTTANDTPTGQWMMSPFASGNIHGGSKTASRYVWPVRNSKATPP